MYDIPVVGFAAWSGAGKTTLIRQLIPELQALGLRTAVIKHDVHGLSLDRDGKDSSEFVRAGAETVLTCSGGELLISEKRGRTLDELLAMVRDADLILVEGYKEEPIRQIGLSRAGRELPAGQERYEAIVTDRADPGAKIETFSFEDTKAIARFIADHRQVFRMPKDENGGIESARNTGCDDPALAGENR